MSGTDALSVLQGESFGIATGMTWAPPAALRALTWDSGVENEPEALEAVAAALGLDLAGVPAEAPWAAEAVARLDGAGVCAAWLVAGVLGRAAERLSWNEVIRSSVAQPGELAFVLDEELHETLESLRAGVAAGAAVLVLADDLAGAAGWIVAPDFALEALLPCYRRAVAEWESPDRASVFHSDGDIRALMGPLKRAGFDGVHLGSPGPAALAPAVGAARFAGLCALGGIETAALVGDGARRAGERAGRLARGNRLIITDDGGMTTAEQVVAFGAALEAARDAARGDAEAR